MRDFFTGLAARSFGAETGVRPRLASLFEPARSLAVSTGFSTPGREAEKETVAAPDELQRRQVSLRPSAEPLVRIETPRLVSEPQRHNLHNSLEEQSERIRAKLALPTIAPSGQDSPHEALQPVSVSNLSLQNVPAAAMRAEATAEAHAFASPRSRVESVEIEAGQQRSVDASRASHDSRRFALTPAQEGRQESQPPFALSSRTIADLAARMRDVASAMNMSASAQQSGRDSDRETSGSAEPIVHVTIGRVEVRATTEAPREKRPRPASPVMGLEEYLQRTAQRGDR